MNRWLLFWMCLTGSLLLSVSAGAETFYVDTSVDLPDTNPGDGIAVAANGRTTLRAAVEEANATPGHNTIVITSAIASSIVPEGVLYLAGPLVISQDLTILVSSYFLRVHLSLDASTPFRPLEVLGGVRFYMERIRVAEDSLRRGLIRADLGAALRIHPGAHVTLVRCWFQDGVASVAGGAIYVDRATLAMHSVTVYGASSGDGGAVYNNLGHVHGFMLLRGEAAGKGGGIYNHGGTVRFTGGWPSGANGNIAGGTALVAGGAIYSDGGLVVADQGGRFFAGSAPLGGMAYLTGGATMLLARGAAMNCAAEGAGGAVHLAGGRLLASQYTFTGNRAGGPGAAIHVEDGEATLINCTIADNETDLDGNGPEAAWASAVHVAAGLPPGALRIGNTVVAGQRHADGGPAPDVVGDVLSLGHNFVGNRGDSLGWHATDTLGTASAPAQPGIVFQEFHPAGSNNYRFGFVLEPGSPLLDAGDPALLRHADFLGSACVDQAGLPRVRGASVDIGSIELQEGEVASPCPGAGHSADPDGDGGISLGELVRVIQLYNSHGYHCAADSEDGYAPGPDPSARDCAPHSADYTPQDWVIALSELLRVIQFYNAGAYHPCAGGEDGFCPGPGTD